MSSSDDRMDKKCIEWSDKQSTDPHSKEFNALLAIYKDEESESNRNIEPFDNFASLESYLAGKKNTNNVSLLLLLLLLKFIVKRRQLFKTMLFLKIYILRN